MKNDSLVDFREAMQGAGIFLAADAHIVPDGQLHRARAADDKVGALSIWYNFHPDAPASGVAGNWRTGAKMTWCSKRLSALSASERAEMTRRMAEDRRRAQDAQEARHHEAAQRATRTWAQAAPADPNHAYLVKKQIAPGIARQSGGALVLPILDFTGQLHGLQFISEDGGKRFISGMSKVGHFIPTTDELPDGIRPLWLSEGWATACTLQAMRPEVCCIAGLDAGNLLSAATEARKRWPKLDLVVCHDFDEVGRQKGRAAAIAARARILPPPAVIPEGCTDWNDVLNARRGVPHVHP
ncbi:hypothetical protein HFU84_12220 [Acidithiobacillus sp. CV18-2]|nr:hypothetical protein [Acidithiobacillus sp. CV18-3]MBU2757520.1 hypothetical protein [Acidithiobacillus sp. BN09-2]MBU2778248.1 hypothetical protein [Acidithiobacillus sp. CV18-2]MBU2799684.1 hypothetical protein [Acidithiobacillus sp. VAN18-4]